LKAWISIDLQTRSVNLVNRRRGKLSATRNSGSKCQTPPSRPSFSEQASTGR